VHGTEISGIEICAIKVSVSDVWDIDIWVAGTSNTEDSGINMWGIERFVEVAFVKVCTS